MYQHAGSMNPDALYEVARWLYVEMLELGYTRVCEFHYLHHQADARRYAPVQRMSQALIAAADEVGIGLTLLPWCCISAVAFWISPWRHVSCALNAPTTSS